MNKFSEKDWKLFRKKISGWQEAYMEKLNREYIVHRQQHHEDGHVHRHARREDGAGEHHRADDRQKRERDGFQQQLVGAHELRRLADQRAAEAV